MIFKSFINVLSRSSLIKRKIVYYFVLAERTNFVKCARKLENMKSNKIIPDDVYLDAKYLVSCNYGEQVLINTSQDKKCLLWQQYNGLPNINLDIVKANSVILNFIMDEEDKNCFALFALNCPCEILDILTSTNNNKLIHIRQSLVILPVEESTYVMQARGLFYFGTSMSYCNECGGQLNKISAGTQKSCSNCEKVYYPNISPVGITLIENDQHEKILLVRQERHPTGMFSCVAGFIETGESLEKNIQREIAEEVGLEVNNVQYLGSQYWSMGTSQLMLGCIATAKHEDFEPDKKEIQDAKWVTAEELNNAINKSTTSQITTKNEFWVPPKGAIAHQLMKMWLEKYHSDVISSNKHSKI